MLNGNNLGAMVRSEKEAERLFLASNTYFLTTSNKFQSCTFVGNLFGDEILKDFEPAFLLRRNSVAEGLLGAPQHLRREKRLRRRVFDVKGRSDQIFLVRFVRTSLLIEDIQDSKIARLKSFLLV